MSTTANSSSIYTQQQQTHECEGEHYKNTTPRISCMDYYYYYIRLTASVPTRVRRYQKSKANLDINEARDDGVWGWQWHQLDHMATICTSLQTDNHTNTFFKDRMPFLPPSQQCQTTEGKIT